MVCCLLYCSHLTTLTAPRHRHRGRRSVSVWVWPCGGDEWVLCCASRRRSTRRQGVLHSHLLCAVMSPRARSDPICFPILILWYALRRVDLSGGRILSWLKEEEEETAISLFFIIILIFFRESVLFCNNSVIVFRFRASVWKKLSNVKNANTKA